MRLEKKINELKNYSGEYKHRAEWTLFQINAFMEIEKINKLDDIIKQFKEITRETKRKKFAIKFLTENV